jgi:hypothetical protein
MKGTAILFFVLIGQISMSGQTIRGRITDEKSNPLPYVSIGIPDSNIGTVSSMDGKFVIDLSGMDKNLILRFSYVGFQNLDLMVGDLRSKGIDTINIKLKESVYRLNEIIIRPDNANPKFLGSKKTGIYTCVWNHAQKGAEIGSLFHITESIILKEFYFHVRTSSCDSIYYRLRIYNGENRYPQDILNTQDIRFISRQKSGWDSVDLSNYNIIVETDFIITLETLDSWSNESKKVTHLSVRGDDAYSFSKESSMAEWAHFGDQMSYRIKYKSLNK